MGCEGETEIVVKGPASGGVKPTCCGMKRRLVVLQNLNVKGFVQWFETQLQLTDAGCVGGYGSIRVRSAFL
jgi:hypothetical protein